MAKAGLGTVKGFGRCVVVVVQSQMVSHESRKGGELSVAETTGVHRPKIVSVSGTASTRI